MINKNSDNYDNIQDAEYYLALNKLKVNFDYVVRFERTNEIFIIHIDLKNVNWFWREHFAKGRLKILGVLTKQIN